jgi:hypothetical protein
VNQPYTQAAIRGFIGALALSGGAFFGTMQIADATPLEAFYVAGGIFCGQVALRLGVEGSYDNRQAKKPPVIGGDV